MSCRKCQWDVVAFTCRQGHYRPENDMNIEDCHAWKEKPKEKLCESCHGNDGKPFIKAYFSEGINYCYSCGRKL